jgi:ABC-type nitrate/sulfonate/bicarbonate transport system substrate-binding protein
MTSQRSFRRITSAAIAAAALLATSACGGGGAASSEGFEGDTIKVGVFPSFNAVSAYTDEVKSSLKDDGVKVEFVTVATPADAAPQLIGGKLQFALMDMTTPILAASQGTSFALVAPGAEGTPLLEDSWSTANIWVAKDSDIKSVKDLPGHTFGVPALNSQIWLDLRTAVDEAGGDSSKIEWVETGRTGVEQLKAGNVDATTTAEPSGTASAKDPDMRHLTGYVSAGGDLGYAFVSTKQFAESNGDLVKKFQDAIVDGNKAFNAMDADAKAAVGQLVIPDAPAELLKAARYPVFQEDEITSENIQAAVERMKKYGMLEDSNAPSAEDLLP